jgi:hypothetical protein
MMGVAREFGLWPPQILHSAMMEKNPCVEARPWSHAPGFRFDRQQLKIKLTLDFDLW